MIGELEIMTALVAGPDAVERMARGGRTIRKLPIQDGSEGWVYPASVRQEAEALGFVFGEKLDDLFIEVTQAPEGWGFRSTDHALYTDIVDDKDRIRGQMSCRTLYDTFANYHFLSRYAVCDVREDGWFEKWQPKTLTKIEQRRVLVDDGNRFEPVERYSPFDGYRGFSYHPRKAPARYEMKDVEVPLPDAQQPKPQPYWQCKGIIDRETGQHIFLTDKMINPARDSPGYMEHLHTREEEENKLWAVAKAELEKRFPNHADVTAYWS